MKLSIYPLVVLLCLLSSSLMAAKELRLEDETSRINYYCLGYQIGDDFKRQSVEIDSEAVVQGINDALSGAEPQMTPSDINTALTELKRKIVAEQQWLI